MKEILQYKKNNIAYILANNVIAMDVVQEFVDDFMNDRNNETFIVIAYHVRGDVILLHSDSIAKGIGFDSAVHKVKESIESGDLQADDANLKKALGDPQATKAKLLLDYITSEGY